ncbi:hypothetical protein SDC9_200551 [bioreactor metagenome]|uniref:Uncharacterized protein n=1 Tax=bioreactor metagenome TaxID=1076179 RepID=A0A645INI6_9ZZZZ
MIGRVERADAAAHGFRKRCFKICAPVIFQKTAEFHDFRRDDAVGCIASEVTIGIPRRPHRALVVQRGLEGEFRAFAKLPFILLAYFYDIACHLMSHDGWVMRHVRRDSFVLLPKDCAFIGGHADAVRNDFYKDFVFLDLRQVEFLKP